MQTQQTVTISNTSQKAQEENSNNSDSLRAYTFISSSVQHFSDSLFVYGSVKMSIILRKHYATA